MILFADYYDDDVTLPCCYADAFADDAAAADAARAAAIAMLPPLRHAA